MVVGFGGGTRRGSGGGRVEQLDGKVANVLLVLLLEDVQFQKGFIERLLVIDVRVANDVDVHIVRTVATH